jgi:hypothetical protein
VTVEGGVGQEEGEEIQANILREITGEEIRRRVMELKNGKAMGEDRIPNEFLKKGGDTLWRLLAMAFNWVIREEEIPRGWKKGRVLLLHKGGDRDVLDNYRGITVSSNMGKLFTRVTASRVEGDAEGRGLLGQIQHGFRKGKSTEDAIYVLTQAVEYQKRKGRKVALAFLDVKKAYDRVWREGLWKVLESLGYGGKLLRVIQALYKDVKATVSLGGIESEAVEMGVGLKQGCNLSPILFALYIRDLGRRLEDSGLGLEVGGMKIPGVFFADDIVLMAQGGKELHQLLQIVGQFGEERKLVFNPKKSKILVSWRKAQAGQRWVLGGVVIREATRVRMRLGEEGEYKYLGVTVRVRGRLFGKHGTDVVNKAKKTSQAIKVVCGRSINRMLVGSVGWEAVGLPRVLYGAGVTCIDKTRIEELERVQNDLARFLTGASKGVALEGLRGELGWWKIRDLMALACLRQARSQEFVRVRDWASMVHEECRGVPAARRSLLQRRVEKWAEEYEVNLQQPVGSKRGWKGYVWRRIEEKVQREWRVGMEGKTSLQHYRSKGKMGVEGYWDGSRGATLVFKARVGDLGLGKKDFNRGGEGECKLCEEGVEEDGTHMLLECAAYGKAREEWGPGGEGLGRNERTAWVLGLGREELGEDQWEAIRLFLSQAWARRQVVLGSG